MTSMDERPSGGQGSADAETDPRVSPRARLVGLGLGVILFATMQAIGPQGSLGPAAWNTASVAVVMACWWFTEAIPVAATALLPLAAFPLLGVSDIGPSATPYANPLIFLFMGGFFLGLAVQRWSLHERISLIILRRIGNRPEALIAGFMAVAAFLSMWVSNTATAVMMMPIGLSVILMVEGGAPDAKRDRGFSVALLLGIAYGASIGGVATLVGTPPNALLAAYLRDQHGIEIGFAAWMAAALPFVLVMLLVTWVMLTRVIFRLRDAEIGTATDAIDARLKALGPLQRGEKRVAAVFVLTALAWVTQPLLNSAFPDLGLTDAGIAMLAALALFLTPVDLRSGTFLLNWDWARRIPWHILLLFGGGLSLAQAISASGLADWIGASLHGLDVLPLVLVVAAIAAVVIFLTEMTSNTATTATFLPVMGALAISLGHDALLFTVPAAIAASCAFMLPVATPPNAVVYSSGHVTIPQMARAGFGLNLIGVVLITAFSLTGIGWVLGR